MKTKNSLLVLLLALSNNALAQTSSTTMATAPAASSSATATSVNSSVANAGAIVADPNKPQLKIKYLGIFKGPGLNSESLYQAASNGSGPDEFEHRFKFILHTSDKFDFGLETRVRTILGSDGLSILNGDYRALANFKHLYKSSFLDLSFSPRLKLPTSNAARNNQLIFAPEFITNLDISTKNSRLSFNTGFLYQQSFYKGTARNSVTTSVIQPWLEVDYQVTDALSGFVSIWPEYVAQARSGMPLTNDSNEINVGTNWEFIKGWTATPYISIEPVGIDTSSAASAAKNMQFNMYVSGAFL